MGVGIFTLLAIGTYAAIDKMREYGQSEVMRESAIQESCAIYYDAKGKTRMVGSNIQVFRSEDDNGDIVYRSVKNRNNILYNETKARSEQKKRQAIAEGKAYYEDYRPTWDGSYCVEIATDQVYTVKQGYGEYFYRYNHYYEKDILGKPKLRKSFKGIPISKEEYIRLGGIVW